MKLVFIPKVECSKCGRKFFLIGMSTCPRCKRAKSKEG